MQLFELPTQLLGRPDLPAVNVESGPGSDAFRQLLERQQSDPPPRSRTERPQQEQDNRASRPDRSDRSDRPDSRPSRERQPSVATDNERVVRGDAETLQQTDDTVEHVEPVETASVARTDEARPGDKQAGIEPGQTELGTMLSDEADGSEAVVAVAQLEPGVAQPANQPIAGPLAFAQRTVSDGEVAAQQILSARAVVPPAGAVQTATVDAETEGDSVAAKAVALVSEPLSTAPVASFKAALDGQPDESSDNEPSSVEEGESVKLSPSGSEVSDEQESDEGDGTEERFSSRANGKEALVSTEKSSFKNSLAGLAGTEKLPGAPVAGVDQLVMDRMVSAINKGQSVQKTVGESGASTTDATTGMAGLGATSATGSNATQGVRGNLTPNLQRAESFDQVIDRTLQMVRGGEREITLRLSPDHLGELHIRVSTGNGGLTAELMAQTTVAKELLESQQQRLQQALLDNGANTAQVNVSLASRDGAAFGGRDSDANAPSRQAGEDDDSVNLPPVTAQVSTRTGLNVVA